MGPLGRLHIEYPVCRSSAELWTYSRRGSHAGRSDALVQLSSSFIATDFVWLLPTQDGRL